MKGGAVPARVAARGCVHGLRGQGFPISPRVGYARGVVGGQRRATRGAPRKVARAAARGADRGCPRDRSLAPGFEGSSGSTGGGSLAEGADCSGSCHERHVLGSRGGEVGLFHARPERGFGHVAGVRRWAGPVLGRASPRAEGCKERIGSITTRSSCRSARHTPCWGGSAPQLPERWRARGAPHGPQLNASVMDTS